MRLCEHINDGNISSRFCNCESKGKTNTSSTSGDDYGATDKREKVLDRTLQKPIRISLKDLLGLDQHWL